MVARQSALSAMLVAGLASAAVARAGEPPAAADQWSAFLAHGTTGQVGHAIDMMDAVGYGLNKVDAAKCSANMKGLAQAVAEVPVSLAVHRAARLCAEANGDTQAAQRESDAFQALATYALRLSGDGAWQRPIPIVNMRDAYALVAASGLEFRYEYYDSLVPKRYFPLVIAAWDPDGKVERHLSFDAVDALHSIDRSDPAASYPHNRNAFAKALAAAESKGDQVVGIDFDAVTTAVTKTTPQARRDAVKKAAGLGGINSLATWLAICDKNRFQGCADGLVDTLLSFAEKKQAMPMTMLAMAYREGVGTTRDEAMADKVLDAADALWLRRGATVAYAELYGAMHPGEEPAWLRQRLANAARTGNRQAAPIELALRLGLESPVQLTDAEVAMLADPGNNGLGHGQALLADYYRKRTDSTHAQAAMANAANAGDPSSQRMLAYAKRDTEGSNGPTAATLALFQDAAQGGDALAMRYLSYRAMLAGQWKDAEQWLLGAVEGFDEGSIYQLAGLWAGEHPGLSGDAKAAVHVYESMAGAEDGAQARRQLAMMLAAGKGVAKDPARARLLLEKDAIKGDVESQETLGGLLLAGQLGAGGVAAGKQWMEKAVAHDSEEAMLAYGSWWYYQNTGVDARAKGMKLMQQASDRGVQMATNNVAWERCVSPYPDVVDAASGLALAKSIEAKPDLTSTLLDTIAACYAANGQYMHATDLQERAERQVAIEAPGEKEVLSRMSERLALYRAGKRYVAPVTPPAKSG